MTTSNVLFDLRRLEPSRKLVKGIACTLGWGNSIVTTVSTLSDFQHWLWGIRDYRGILAGLGLALFLFLGQLYTLRRTAWGYGCFLAPDAMITAYKWCEWLFYPIAYKLTSGLPAIALAWGAGLILGIVSARWPEYLAFGRTPQEHPHGY
ncbi:hypothetical protein [Herpetosiphon llansteffanensis]|uniref:hypothetical protein n=1 Tax=Herpetosiphon llansteffanensis TaxID=2094568 RepID=UPI000D7C6133|nr:hypothetical protein [Herpetosiphon llansteffanensis]